jgi:hypothetical protein
MVSGYGVGRGCLRNSLTLLGLFGSSLPGSQLANMDFFSSFRCGLLKVEYAGFLPEDVSQNVRVSLVLPQNAFVPLVNLVHVDG